MPLVSRPDRAVFRFAGPDAQKLLNDVITGHVTSGPGPAKWWALLSPQGKVLAEGLIGWAEEALWLDVHRSVADDFFKRMRMYKLRAQMTIDDLRATHAVFWSEGEVGGIAHEDMRAPGLGWRVIAETAAEGDDAGQVRARIAAGIAELGPDFAGGEAFAHDLGMDILDGIDFQKGCYVGQEVVSRMKHRGTARRRPVIVSGIGGTVAAGAPVTIGEREAGSIGRVVDGRAVAILRLDRVTDPGLARVGGGLVGLALPEWATYRFGEAVGEE